MGSSLETLVIGKVIKDVIDEFVPSINMSVNYGSKNVKCCHELKPSLITSPPSIQISGNPHDLFTLIMTDPDAPSPSDPSMREVVHWVVTNIPGGGDAARGEEVLPYMAPQPIIGIHRYVFILFQQKKPIKGIYKMETRAYFRTRTFSSLHDLGLPVAAVFFNCHKEPKSRIH